jgi:hypothetical protein
MFKLHCAGEEEFGKKSSGAKITLRLNPSSAFTQLHHFRPLAHSHNLTKNINKTEELKQIYEIKQRRKKNFK